MDNMSAYVACSTCKTGSPDDDGIGTAQFLSEHALHRNLRFVPETTFLSTYLEEGYVDLKRPNLKPLPLAPAGIPLTRCNTVVTPFGLPASRDDLLTTHRRLIREAQRSLVSIVPAKSFWDRARARFHSALSPLLRNGTIRKRLAGLFEKQASPLDVKDPADSDTQPAQP